MEFFGVEVPAGNPTTCSPGYGMYLHVSQAALGDSKGKPGKAHERVVVNVSVEPHNEIVLGTLVEGKCDQMHLDLVFDRDFTISHTGKTSSVYICGYRTEAPEEEDDDEDEFEDEEDDEEEKDAPVPTAVPIVNGAAEVKSAKAGKSEDGAKTTAKATEKAANTIATAIAKVVEKTNSKKQAVEEDDDSEEEDDSDEDEGLEHPFLSELASESDDEFDAGDDSDEDMDDDDDEEDDDEEDDSYESEEEEVKTPEVKAGKKRSAAQPVKAAEKKAKTDASPKPEQVSVNGKKGKKSAQATPEKKEAAPKTPTDKAQKPAKAPKGTPTAPPPTPVSAKKIGDYKCTGCERTFTSESALTQHTAAKHK